MKILKFIFNFILNLLEVLLILMILANMWVFALTNGRTYNKISKIPPRETALVLGTSPKMKSGIANPYFVARMEAVAMLYHQREIGRASCRERV